MANSNDDKPILELILDEMKDTRRNINDINITLAKQHVSIDEHIKRTNALETIVNETRKEIEPIKDHVRHVEGALKLLGLIGLGIGIVTGLIQVVSLLF